jgi:hypothetical protein
MPRFWLLLLAFPFEFVAIENSSSSIYFYHHHQHHHCYYVASYYNCHVLRTREESGAFFALSRRFVYTTDALY